MSQLVKKRFNRLIDTAIIVIGTEPIIPAMVFAKIGRYSAYIEHYYMHTSRMMILIVEPVSNCRIETMYQHGEMIYWKFSYSDWLVLFLC